MATPGEWNQARMSLCFVLWMAAGAAAAEATSPRPRGDVSPDPATIFSRIIRSNVEKSVKAERPLAGDVMRKLWHGRVSAPEQPDSVQDQIALDELVRKIRSVKFQPREQEPPVAPTFVMPEPVTKRLEAAPAQEKILEQTASSVPIGSAAPERTLPPEAAEALKRVLADPNQAGDPQELAELLYLTGKLPEAAVLYQKALDLTSDKEPAARADRAWMLLQLGNCLRDTDPAKAKDAYAKVIAEHADCPWVELAKAHSQFITWYEQVQPRQWVAVQEAPAARQVAASQKSQP
jgi:tetratricopeptide (TPR) repeat protein